MQAPGRLIGRDAELARLREAAGIDAEGGLVVLSGDAGIGKTRLLAHLAAAGRTAGWGVAVGHCVGLAGAALPYLPFSELLATVEATDPDAVAAVLAAHPALAQLLPGHPGSDAAASPARLAEAVHAALSAAADRRPLLVIVEDAHWADHSSRDLLTLLLTRGFAARVALVVSYRSDDLHRGHPLHATLPVWARLPGVERLQLAPLQDADMRTLVTGLDAAADPAAVEGVVRRAEGNAFFAEELVASGTGELGADLARVLRSRFEQLGADAQLAVRALSVGGRRLPHELVAAVVDLPADRLDAALRAAVDHHTLEPTGDGYAFRHALLAEAVADDLLPGERVRLHRAWAEALGARPELAPASELSRHAAASGDVGTAIAAGRRAGEAALAMGGPREALAQFEAVLGWMADDDPARDVVTVKAADAASAAGDQPRAAALLRDRLTHPGGEDAEGRARLLAAWVVHSRHLMDPTDQLERATEALALTRGRTDGVRLAALHAHTQALADLGRYEEATEAAEGALALAAKLGRADLVTDLRTILFNGPRRLQDADAFAERLAALVQAGGRDPATVRACHSLGLLELERGRLAEARRWFDEGSRIGDRLARPWGPFETMSRCRGALATLELGELGGVESRLATPGGSPPRAAAVLFDAVRIALHDLRDAAPDPTRFEARERGWWDGDGVAAITAVPAQLQLLGRAGRPDDAVALFDVCLTRMLEDWGRREQVYARLGAVLIGVLADRAGRASPETRARWRGVVDRAYALSDFMRVADAGEPIGPESRAWLARLEAERLRFGLAVGDDVDAAEHVRAWRRAAADFRSYSARVREVECGVRLAGALALTGDLAAARAEADAARAAADAMGARGLASGVEPEAAGRGGGALTPREAEILALLASGMTNGQIGRKLFISTKTASVHVSNLLGKLGAANRGQAVALARERGLL